VSQGQGDSTYVAIRSHCLSEDSNDHKKRLDDSSVQRQAFYCCEGCKVFLNPYRVNCLHSTIEPNGVKYEYELFILNKSDKISPATDKDTHSKKNYVYSIVRYAEARKNVCNSMRNCLNSVQQLYSAVLSDTIVFMIYLPKTHKYKILS
jgi:hypothetical protein